jgi:hypothetical protein
MEKAASPSFYGVIACARKRRPILLRCSQTTREEMVTAFTPLTRATATTTAEIEAEVVTAVETETEVTIARGTETEREVEVETENETETATDRAEIGAEIATETAAERGSTQAEARCVATLAEETVGSEIAADFPMRSRRTYWYGTIIILRDTIRMDTYCIR